MNRFINQHIFLFILFAILFPPLAQAKLDIAGQAKAHILQLEQDKAFNEYMRAAVFVDGSLDLDDKGCTQLKARLSTGSRFNSAWSTAGWLDGDEDLKASFRHMYLNYSCLRENIDIAAGALPVNNPGRLGLAPDGWVDGVRVVIRDENNGRVWIAEVGSIDDFDEPNLFKRGNWGDVNHKAVTFSQDFGKDRVHQILISVDEFEDTPFIRAGLKVGLVNYFQWFESVAVEVLNADGHQIANMVETIFNVGKWRFRVFRTDIDPNPTEIDEVSRLVKYYYGEGENYFGEASRRFGKDDRYRGLLRYREGDAGRLLLLEFTRYIGR